jgi:uncharacterized protein
MVLTLDTRAPAATASAGERIGSLDVLRGIALLGMFLVHFNDQSVSGASVSVAAESYQRAAALFFEERFWTMFGILFGAGFALQLRSAEARGTSFVPAYLRRMTTLATFGLFTHAVFGYHVLLEYAAWGVPLLLIRRWSTRALLVALVVSASSGAMFAIGRSASCALRSGEAECRAQFAREAAAAQAFRAANNEAQESPRYAAVFAARLRHIAWFYAQPYSFLPVNTFTLFLIGVLGLRLGVFERPEDHRPLIVGCIVFGIGSWAAATWMLPPPALPAETPLIRATTIAYWRAGFGLVRQTWLTLAYIGVVLLAVARSRAWLRRLGPFAWTGRTALTNYIIQVALLDLLFANYGAALRLTPLQGAAAAMALFGAFAILSRWWLSRFRFGPLEWLWRSATYARWQSMQRARGPREEVT